MIINESGNGTGNGTVDVALQQDGVSIFPSYVRSFQAASFPEAIDKVGQILARDDQVTVALWRNRVESLSHDQLCERQESIRKLAALSARETTKTASGIAAAFNYVTLTFMLERGGVAFLDDYDFKANTSMTHPFLSSIDPYLPLPQPELDYLRSNFKESTGFLAHHSYEFDEVLSIHRDRICAASVANWHYSALRVIEPLWGSSTRFYADRNGRAPYDVPEGSMAFFLSARAGDKAAWHSATHINGKDRAFFSMTLE